jgi:hypothetical protein
MQAEGKRGNNSVSDSFARGKVDVDEAHNRRARLVHEGVEVLMSFLYQWLALFSLSYGFGGRPLLEFLGWPGTFCAPDCAPTSDGKG